MSKSDPRWHRVALFLIVVAVGFWPFREILHHYPEGSDALKWVTNAAPITDGWFEWVFESRHFIGYRPVTAFSFTLNYAFTGWAPWGYRLTNAGLHIGTGVMVYALFRVLMRDRGWWAVLAAAIFFAHPASETVLPHIARRSYLLGSLFSVSTLVAWTVATRDRDHVATGSMAAACLCLGAALLSNEIAYVVVPMLPLMALVFRDRKKPWYNAMFRCIPAAVVTVSLLGLRYLVLGHFGGYHKRYFAYTRNNHNLLREVDDTPYQMVFEAAWRYMCFPTAASGDQALLLLGGSAGLMLAIAIVAYYAWRAIAEPLLPGKTPEQRVVLLIFIWLAGHTLLYALTRNWFWRQSYPMLAPFALLVAMVARDTWTRAGNPYLRVLHMLPQALLVVSILYNAPVLKGIDTEALRGQFKASAIVHEVKASLENETLESPAVIYLAMGVRGPAVRDALIWIRREYRPRGVQFKWLAHLRAQSQDKTGKPVIDIVAHDDRLLIKLRDHAQWDTKLAKTLRLEDKTVVWMDRLHITSADHAYIYQSRAKGPLLTEAPPPVKGSLEPIQPKRKSKRKKKKKKRDKEQQKQQPE